MLEKYQIIDLSILLFGLAVLGVLRRNYGNFVGEVVSMAFSRSHIVRYSESSNLSMRLFLTYSAFIYFFVVSVFFFRYLFGAEFTYVSEGAVFFFIILASIVIVKLLTYGIYYFIGNLTFNKFEASVVVNSDLVLSVASGFILLLPSVFYPFLSVNLEDLYIYFGAAVLLGFYLLKILYGIITVFGKMPLVHILLLILSVEILPVLVLIKFLRTIEFTLL